MMLATRSDLPTHSCKTVAADANDATWNVGPAPRQLMLMMLATLGRLMLMMLGARVAHPRRSRQMLMMLAAGYWCV